MNPLTMWAYLRIIRSSQPQRRFLPVVTPHSWPRLCSRSPISCGATGRARGLWGWSLSQLPTPPSCGPLTTTPPHARSLPQALGTPAPAEPRDQACPGLLGR